MEFDKSKVYTALNADDLRVGDKVFTADTIACLYGEVKNGEDVETIDEILPGSEMKRFLTKEGYVATCFAYLVEKAPKQKFRPYKDVSELKSDRASFMGYSTKPLTNPIIWVKAKKSKAECLISGFVDDKTVGFGSQEVTLSELFENFTYLDDSPIGRMI